MRSIEGLPVHLVTTTVTFADLAVGPLVAEDDRERARRLAVLQQAEADLEVVPFDMPQPGPSAAWRQTFGAGCKPTTRSYDAMIAAIALSRGWPVHTAKSGDFAHIDGLVVVAPPAA